jgi:site-specific DNA-methyltransferase (adenine-specific)
VTIEPYYRSEDGRITVYCARWEEVLDAGLVPVRDVALIHGDPPYGIKYDTKIRVPGDKSRLPSGGREKLFPRVTGDEAPFDPARVLALGRPTVLWGGNHYCSRLPDSPSWILWDKIEDQGSHDGADGEAAWSNLGGPLRIFRHFWRGALRRSEKEHVHLHPTQKPIALCSWVYERAKLKRGDLVFVPYMGSGPDLPAAMAMGLRVIACDVEEWCCRTAVAARLQAAPKPEPTEKLGPLFEIGRVA